MFAVERILTIQSGCTDVKLFVNGNAVIAAVDIVMMLLLNRSRCACDSVSAVV
jgi:hypothetical protein